MASGTEEKGRLPAQDSDTIDLETDVDPLEERNTAEAYERMNDDAASEITQRDDDYDATPPTDLPNDPAQEAEAAGMPTLKRRRTRLANKKAHPMEHIGITFGLPMILLFDLIIPCIIYYTWYNKQRSRWEEQCLPWHN